MFKKTQIAIAVSTLFMLPSLSAAESYTYDEVVVSATRTEQSKKDVSASVATVSSEEMKKNLNGNLKDALKYTPGVDAQGSSRFGISGVNIRGVEASRVKMMVDGVQQPVPYNPGSSEQRKYPNTIEIDTLERIEVNKGPASTLYGSDALGGVVLMKTKNPEDILVTDGDEHRFGIKSGYSSANEEFKTTLTWAMRQDKLETLMLATYADGSETETHGSGSDIEGVDRGAANPADKKLANLLAKAFYQLNDNHRIGLTTEYHNHKYDEDELNYNGYTIMPGFDYSDNYNKDTNKRLRVGFEHKMLMNSIFADTLDWSINYQDSSSLSKNYDTTGFYGRRMREREASDTSIQFDAQLSKVAILADYDHEFTYGVSYLNNDFELNNTDYRIDSGTQGPGSTGIPNAEVSQWGMFLQDQAFLLEDSLILTAGLRFDSFSANPSTSEGYSTEYDKNEDSAFTGKLGSVYHFNDNLSMFAQVSQGFKAPTVYDLYYFYNHGAIVEANPNLKAEKSTAYETGFRGQNEKANFEIAFFYNDYTDFITQETTGQRDGKDVITKKNLSEVEIYGVEFSSKVQLDKAFDAPQGMYSKVTVSYLEGEDKKSGGSLDAVAPLTGIVGLGLERETYGSELNVKMVAAKDEWQSDANVDVAGYTLVDMTAYYKPMPGLHISAGLFNLLDKKYWLYNDISGQTATSLFNKDIKSQPGRNWGVVVDYQF